MAEAITIIELHSQVLFAPGGSVREWSRGVTKEIEVAAKAMAPPMRSKARWPTKATGKMARSIRGRLNRTTLHILRADVYVRDRRAKYVLGGTANGGRGFIYSRAGYANRSEIGGWMEGLQELREETGVANQGMLAEGLPSEWFMNTPYGPKVRVKGQRANPFLKDGYNAVAAHHAALKRL